MKSIKQRKIPDAWWLQENDEVEVNGKKYKVKMIGGIPDEPPRLRGQKWIYLNNDYALIVDEKEMEFSKIIREGGATGFEKQKLRSFKILKCKFLDEEKI